MIKPTQLIILLFCVMIIMMLLNWNYKESKEFHKPRFKIKQELKATDTTQSMDLHPDDIKRLENS